MVDQAYNDETQRAAVPNVNKSRDAVKTTASASYAQSAAQTHSAWGNENGPSTFRNSVADMFKDIAEILKKENDLISAFETNVHLTMEEAKGVEWDNQQALRKVNDMLDNVASSKEAEALAKQLEEKKYMDKRPEPQTAPPPATTGQPDPSQTGAATGQPDPSQSGTTAPAQGSQDDD
jgi:hypothetical protein